MLFLFSETAILAGNSEGTENGSTNVVFLKYAYQGEVAYFANKYGHIGLLDSDDQVLIYSTYTAATPFTNHIAYV